MIKVFQYNNVNGNVELATAEILLIKEFSELMKEERNICNEDKTGKLHLRAYREFAYIYLAIDWQSPYADYLNQEKHQMALEDAKLTDDEFNDPDFRAACRKYKELQGATRSIRLLLAALDTVDKFIDYFHNIDVEERDLQTGKPIWKVETIMKEIASLSKVHDELKALEGMVKKEMSETSTLRGGYEDGYTPSFMKK